MMPDAVSDRIEPDAKAIVGVLMMDSDSFNSVFLASIAISMRRIADAVTYQAAGDYNLFDHIRQIAEKS